MTASTQMKNQNIISEYGYVLNDILPLRASIIKSGRSKAPFIIIYDRRFNKEVPSKFVSSAMPLPCSSILEDALSCQR